ncbi:hypothetical protein [Pseudoalteromonas sp. T1lg23B]|uniref:hypothetical protein n=1 Tax=Pseudoalteromonas sp. T1lg23B TaxID=2077097 RepID=UPI00131A427B|nr:hypothetical protein [Pseudoalteromonas sp. T1lg23B]
MDKLKMLALAAVATAGVSGAAQAGEMCQDIAYRVAVEWDEVKEYRARCSYYADYMSNDGLSKIVGGGESYTAWVRDRYSIPNCPSYQTVPVLVTSVRTGMSYNSTATGFLANTSFEEKVVDRVATRWETKIVWRDRYGNPCKPYIN